MCSKVKYWWSSIIHSFLCFSDICFMSGNMLTGTIIWRPSVSMTLNLPRILKSKLLIPTDMFGILHIVVLFLFEFLTYSFNSGECLVNLVVYKLPVFIYCLHYSLVLFCRELRICYLNAFLSIGLNPEFGSTLLISFAFIENVNMPTVVGDVYSSLI